MNPMDGAGQQSHPSPDDEEERLADLYSYSILDTAPEGTYDDLTRLASVICDRPIAAITFIDEHRQWVKAEIGGGAQIGPRSESFCAHAIVGPGDVLVVGDTTKHPEFKDNPFVVGEPHLRFYAGAPIESSRGHGLGTVCVLDTEPGSLTDEQREALQALSRVVSLKLELRRTGRHLEHANRDLQSIAGAVSADVQDLVSSISSSLAFAAKQAEDVDDTLQAAIADAQDATQELARSVGRLADFSRTIGRTEPTEVFGLFEALEDAKEDLREEIEETGALIEGHGLPVVTGDRHQVHVLLRNLLSNAIRHGGDEPRIDVSASREEDRWRILVQDDGPGIPEEEQDRIFGMFEQGPSQDGEGGPGMGLALCRRIVERHGGEMEVDSSPGEGSVFSFTLPGPVEG